MPSLKLTIQTAIPMTPTPPHASSSSQRPTQSLGPLQSVSGMTVTCISHPVRPPMSIHLLAARPVGDQPVVSVAEERSSAGPLPVSTAREARVHKAPKELRRIPMHLLLLRCQVLVDLDLQVHKWVAMMTCRISTMQDISGHRSIRSSTGDPEGGRVIISNPKWIEECS